MTVLEARAISLIRDGRRLLDAVDFHVAGGEMVGLLGPNGAGKSTLLRTVSGLLRPEDGSITLDGIDLARVPLRERARRLAYLPQGQAVHWPLPVAQVVALGRLPHRPAGWRTDSAERARVLRAMEDADVLHLADRPVTDLSGGERARVLLARALAGEPAVLLADEPVAGLDPAHQLDVMALLRHQAEQGGAVVVVLHDLTLAARYCHRLVLLANGRCAAAGSVDEVLTAEHLAGTYHIRAHTGELPDGRFIVPWERLP